MALLDQTQQGYYQGNSFGNYQFVSLDDIINQFMVVYVGKQKIIPSCTRVDVAFHAQRALAELSFDTFKSLKAQEIVVPPTLQMILPHDYVNYTKISSVDSAGIKHPIYFTRHTSNPFSITQDDDGNYSFPGEFEIGVNMDFTDGLINPWNKSGITPAQQSLGDIIDAPNGFLNFKQFAHNSFGRNLSKIYKCYQPIDVADVNQISMSAKGTTQGAGTKLFGGDLKLGIIGIDPNVHNPGGYTKAYTTGNNVSPDLNMPWLQTSDGNDSVLEWTFGESGVTKELAEDEFIDVSTYSTIWVVITSVIEFDMSFGTYDAAIFGENSVDDIVISNLTEMQALTAGNSNGNSTTWTNYKSTTPSEVENDNYEDDVYWPYEGERYGLNPEHAQTNGSFYIDNTLGKIHFSSNLSGKTVVLDYISDGLGTESEMQVHKFAEEAMYRYILHAIASSQIITQQIVPRLKREKFAAIRNAKLRLSNIKLEDITQVLRGKSKHIKH